MWFWCMDVAIPDTEKENTEPLQSPQPGQAHQGWIRGTPQMCWVALHPVHANYPCILQPSPSEPNTLNGKPPQPSFKQPTPSHKMSLPPNVDQADATGSACGSPTTTVVPPNHVTPTQHGDSPKANFYNSILVFTLAKQMWVTCVDNM